MWSYRNPVNVHFGQGSFARLADHIAARSYVLVTYGEPYFRSLAEELAARAGKPRIIIDDIAPNPDISRLGDQCARLSALPVAPDLVVAIGGGSVIDSAKVFAAARTSGIDTVKAYLLRSGGSVALDPLPLIAVPTTAGTGSEVTSWGTVWDHAAGVKHSLAHARLYPELALIDPLLMRAKPRALTIQTGLDALSHALESLWNRNANPVSTAHAVAAARGVLQTLPRLVDDLENVSLRSAMAKAAVLAGFAFSNTKTAIAHSISYPITMRHDTPHGIACSFTLPMIMRSVDGCDDACTAALAAIFDAPPSAAANRLSRQLESLGVSVDPAAYGIGAEEWSSLITAAFDGERGQNFIGERSRLLSAAGVA